MNRLDLQLRAPFARSEYERLTARGRCMDLEPDARHDDVRIDEFEGNEHAEADLRERIRDARS